MRLPQYITDWPTPWRELYEERAAIIEFSARLSRPVAESLAEEDIRRQAANADWEPMT